MTWKLLFISLLDLEASFTHPSDTEASITPLVMRKSVFLFLVDAEASCTPIGDTEASFTPQSDTEASFYTAFVSNFILSFLTYLLAS